MKRIAVIFLALIFATGALAQEKAEEFNTVREFRNKVFTVQNREARNIFSTIKLLGSGFKGAAMSVNEDLRTITVRDFPENLAAMEDAIKRLDQPISEPDMDLKISVLIGSKTPLASPAVPEDLAPVVKQLQSTLQYTHYGLMTASMHRTKATIGMQGSGVAEPTLLGMTAVQDRPIMYDYTLRSVSLDATGPRTKIDIGTFRFSMRVPIDIGGAINYQSVGFETPVSIREGEKVVIGTTTMRDKALIVVVTATVQK